MTTYYFNWEIPLLTTYVAPRGWELGTDARRIQANFQPLSFAAVRHFTPCLATTSFIFMKMAEKC